MTCTDGPIVDELGRIESDDSLHDFGGTHGRKGHDFASYWVINRLIELEQIQQTDYLFVSEYVQDVAEFDSSSAPTEIRLYQLKKKEDGYWEASELTGQTEKKKKPKPEKPISKLIRHVRAFKIIKARGAFVSNAKFKVSLATGQSSVNDSRIGMHLLDDAHTSAIRASIAEDEKVPESEVDLSLIELYHATLALDDLQKHTSGVMLGFLNTVASEHSGQASSLVETLYAKINERARRTEKCIDWNDLVKRRGFGRLDFKGAVESLRSIPDKYLIRTRLLERLSKNWRINYVAKVTMHLAECARDKVLIGHGNRWSSDSNAIAAICDKADAENLSDEELFENVSTILSTTLSTLSPPEISALAIYEIAEWTTNQTLA